MRTHAVLLIALLAGSARAEAPRADLKALVARGVALHDEGKYDEAIAVYAEVLEKDPGNEDALHETAFSLLRKGDHEAAVAICRRVLAQRTPRQEGFHVTLGSALDALGLYEEAEKALRQGLKTWPRSQPLHYNLAVNLVMQGKLDKAERELESSLRTNDEHPGTWRGLATIAERSERRLGAYLANARFVTLAAPGPARTQVAQQLWDALFERVEIGAIDPATDQKATTIMVAPDAKPAHGGEDFAISIVGASRALSENEGLTDARFFVGAFDSAIGMAGELLGRDGKRWWPVVASAYFKDARAAGHLETIAWSVREAAGDEEAKAWMAAHADRVAAQRSWHDAWSFTDRTPGAEAGTSDVGAGKP